MKTLILGGVRSGKSRLAERLALDSGLHVTCIATAAAQDEEMRTRIAAHRARRPNDWQVIEEPVHLGAALTGCAGPGCCVLVDCLTLWLTNLLMAGDANLFHQERVGLLAALPAVAGRIILVSNETSMGVIPAGELSRRFCDEAGRLHQDIAQVSDNVILTVAGLPHVLKGEQP